MIAPAAALLLFSAAALLNTVGGFIFFTAISTGSAGGTYTTTTSLYILLSLLAGVLFLGEPVGPLAAVGAAGHRSCSPGSGLAPGLPSCGRLACW